MEYRGFESRRRAADRVAVGVIKGLSFLAIVILVLILGYIAVRGLVSSNQYEVPVVPAVSSGSVPFTAVVGTGNNMNSLAYPTLRDFFSGKVFSLRRITSVDADVRLYIEHGLEQEVMDYLGLDAEQLAKSRPTVGTAEEVLSGVAQERGGIALVYPGTSLEGYRKIKEVTVGDMVLAVHPSVVALEGNIRLSMIAQKDMERLLSGAVGSWKELGGQDLPVVRVDTAAEVKDTAGAIALLPYREAIAQNLSMLQINTTVRSRNLTLSYLVEKPVESGKYGGISTIIGNTVLMVLISTLCAAPLGIGAAAFLVEYPKNKRLLSIIRSGVDVLAGIPSIIFGLFGLLVFVQLFGWSFSLLSGSLTIAIMILPTIVRTSEEAIRSVDHSLVEASMALGATKVETIWKVVIPAASQGITTGVILAIGRAIGETAALIYTVGSSTDLATGPLDSARVLAMHIYLTITEGQSLDRAFASALVLVVLVLAINIIARKSARRLLGHGE